MIHIAKYVYIEPTSDIFYSKYMTFMKNKGYTIILSEIVGDLETIDLMIRSFLGVVF